MKFNTSDDSDLLTGVALLRGGAWIEINLMG